MCIRDSVRSAGPPEPENGTDFDFSWITIKTNGDEDSIPDLIFSWAELKTLITNQDALDMVAEQAFKEDDRDEDGTIN